MASPAVTAVAVSSPAERAGFLVHDTIVSINGIVPLDVIEYHQLTDGEVVDFVVRRPGETLDRKLTVTKAAGVPVGLEVSSAVFDRIRTCDNHCSFCFIYQLPKGLRRSLYLKDDDYRLSFLYGNFTTLTRFTELDAERVIEERLSPLFVSIHATDPEVRSSLLRNPKGATSLRWLEVLLDADIEVHGQVVICPGINDGAVLVDTLVTILDRYSKLATVGVVPLGLSDHSGEPDMVAHTPAQAAAVIDTVETFADLFGEVLGRRTVYASDEFYLVAGRPFPDLDAYDGTPQHENGIGIVRSFEAAFCGETSASPGVRHGFFASVDGAPAEGYRARRVIEPAGPKGRRKRVGILTGSYGATVLRPMLDRCGFDEVVVVEVENRFFGGNIAVAGLMVGEDLCRVIGSQDPDLHLLLPDVCLSEDRFLDGLTLQDLPREVEVVHTDGAALRAALDFHYAATPPERELVIT